MKSLKRLITVVIALAMILTSVGIPAFAANFSDITNENVSTAVDKLVANGIITGYEDGTFKPDNQITRAEFAAIVTRMKGVANNLGSDAVTGFTDLDNDGSRAWARPYVKAAVDLKIINGFEDGTFRAAEPVTYEQAVKMLVCAIGYEVVANSELNKIKISNPNATWSAGYITAAVKHGITKNAYTTQVTEPANRGVVAVLTSNSLEVPELKENEDGSYEKNEGQNAEQSLVEVKGVVTGTYYTGLDSDNVSLAPNELNITTETEEVKYQLSQSLSESIDLEDYIGKYVVAYYDKFDRVITSISQRNNKSLVINEADVIRPASAVTLNYYSESGSRQSVSISDYTFLYNGKYVAADNALIQNLDANFKNGQIELVDSGGYKTAKITSYEVFVVNGFTKATGKLTFKYGKTYDNNDGNGPQNYYQFSGTTDSKPVIYVNKTKKSYDSLSLSAYNVINYMESPVSAGGNKIKKMYVTTGAKKGKVTAQIESARKKELDYTQYYLTNDYANYLGSDKAPFNLGDNYNSYYLDYTGQIAAVNYNPSQASSYKLGYIIDADSRQIKLVKEDGKIEDVNIKSKVRFDGKSGVSASEVKGLLVSSATSLNNNYNAIFTSSPVSGISQPVKYSLSSEGEVDGIDTIAPGEGGSGDAFSYDAPLSGVTKPGSNNVTINAATYQFDKAKILYVPENRANTSEYSVLTASDAFNSTDRYIEIFGSDAGSKIKNAGLVLIYGSDPSLNFTGDSPYFIVTGKTPYGDNVVIHGYKNGSKDGPIDITVNTEKFKVDTNISARSVSYDDVAEGDLIRYLGTDTAVSRIEMIYDADDSSKNLNTSNGISFTDTSGTRDYTYVKYGEVYQNEDGKNFYITTELGNGDKIAKLMTYVVGTSTVVYSIENEELISSNDISIVSDDTPDRVIVISGSNPGSSIAPIARVVYIVQ